MDPDEILAQLRGWAAEALARAPMDCAEWEAAKDFNDLDEWLVNGGYFPVEWANRGRSGESPS